MQWNNWIYLSKKKKLNQRTAKKRSWRLNCQSNNQYELSKKYRIMENVQIVYEKGTRMEQSSNGNHLKI